MSKDIDNFDSPNNNEPVRGQDTKILADLWNLFSSMKTAIVLLLALAVVSVVGTLIQQNAPPEEYIKGYGANMYALFKNLGLTDVYHCSWYRFLLTLVGINLFVCSINRFKGTWKRAYQPKVWAEATRISSMQMSERISSSDNTELAGAKIRKALQSGSYSVLEEKDKSDVVLYASKGKISLWGPYLTHVSILIIFLGAIMGGLLGSHGFTTIVEGSHTDSYFPEGSDQPAKLGFEVALRKFKIEYDSKHNPTAYKSDLQVLEQHKPVVQKVIDVNHPLMHKGISFYQASYGLAGLYIIVTAPDGDSVKIPFKLESQAGPNGNQYKVSGEPFRQAEICGKKITVFVHNLAPDYVGGDQINATDLPINPAVEIMANDRFPEYKGLDGWSKPSWLSSADTIDYKGYKITLGDVVDYTGLEVSQNPGLNVVYAGFALLMAGVFLSFYISHKVIRVRISSLERGSKIVIGALSRGDTSAFDHDFEKVRNALA